MAYIERLVIEHADTAAAVLVNAGTLDYETAHKIAEEMAA